jgi:hypothetical protein
VIWVSFLPVIFPMMSKGAITARLRILSEHITKEAICEINEQNLRDLATFKMGITCQGLIDLAVFGGGWGGRKRKSTPSP